MVFLTVSLKKLDDLELTLLYSSLLKELKQRGIIRTNNVVGELGEYLAINFYNKTKGLPKLQAAPTGTQNIDALSIKGDRYSIKTTTGSVTGVFYGMNDPEIREPDIQKFEYVIIVLFDKEYSLKGIYELSWESFIKHKRWHKRMRAWNLTITKALLSDSEIIFEKESKLLN
ncbi:hypothetical protein ACT3UT_14075 [Bacillus spizizenii ATCC 6633 = JCM 2499]|uniref:hypothetical protein n=1 Tax=Bacillus TaxID=1386 RepID=UPI001E63B125|nr:MULTISPECIES: hypothetical protein [Bacillus subtilis group]MCM3414581.1 hypothetical protein [Bacillus spizizenii]MCY7818844.1 hypothetical protein [Bacillus inaquosorum]MEC1814029.1 hypothetical protein [Bacillus spizizenii]MEC1915041.1 hypothetical protein [Bacillus spizizenii]MEC1998615.1 hypothetical protein [Bacillus spizizenii]